MRGGLAAKVPCSAADLGRLIHIFWGHVSCFCEVATSRPAGFLLPDRPQWRAYFCCWINVLAEQGGARFYPARHSCARSPPRFAQRSGGNVRANDLEFEDDARPVRREGRRIATCRGLVREPSHRRQCDEREPGRDAAGERTGRKRCCGSQVELANLRREPRSVEPNRRLVDIREHGLIGGELPHPNRRQIGIVDMNKDLAAVSNQGADAAMQGGKRREL